MGEEFRMHCYTAEFTDSIRESGSDGLEDSCGRRLECSITLNACV